MLDDAGERFTPACAGTAKPAVEHAASSAVHPRVCGDSVTSAASSACHCGSPPRVRGQRSAALHPGSARAVHPRVCGDSAHRRASLSPRATVHPRVCGDSVIRYVPEQYRDGSPPRVRGQRRPSAWTRSVRTVHPRVCGDSSDGVGAASGIGAVHPRVCGDSVPRHATMPRRPRFTPACAGTATLCGEVNRAEPRFTPACAGTAGELRGLEVGHGGSPPRVRGQRRRAGGHRSAGSVHPRVCGDSVHLRSPSGVQVRFTPACAGTALRYY